MVQNMQRKLQKPGVAAGVVTGVDVATGVVVVGVAVVVGVVVVV